MIEHCIIRQETIGNVDILRFDGALDSHSFARLEHVFNGLLNARRFRIVLDCDKLDYINSASLGALIGFARKVREQGGDLKLAALSAKIHGIVTLLGFDKILRLYPDASSATADFDPNEP